MPARCRSRLESCNSSVWISRRVELQVVVVGPMRTDDLIRTARAALKWSESLVRNVLAYSDGDAFVFRESRWYPKGLWEQVSSGCSAAEEPQRDEAVAA